MKKKILVVDDFENTLFVIKFTLERAGYEVYTAKSGDDALASVTKDKFDLIITDFHMPKMNGIELTKAVKKDPFYLKVPMVILSTETNQTIKTEALKAGAAIWLQKPFQPEIFLKTIEKLLR